MEQQILELIKGLSNDAGELIKLYFLYSISVKLLTVTGVLLGIGLIIKAILKGIKMSVEDDKINHFISKVNKIMDTSAIYDPYYIKTNTADEVINILKEYKKEQSNG